MENIFFVFKYLRLKFRSIKQFIGATNVVNIIYYLCARKKVNANIFGFLDDNPSGPWYANDFNCLKQLKFNFTKKKRYVNYVLFLYIWPLCTFDIITTFKASNELKRYSGENTRKQVVTNVFSIPGRLIAKCHLSWKSSFIFDFILFNHIL